MPVLYRASSGYLLRHPWQLALAILGIAVGVAVMVAVDLATQSSRKAFIASMDTINGDATHQVVAGPGGVEESFYVRLRVNLGIRTVAPIVSGYVRIKDTTMQVLGVDVFAEREFRSFTSLNRTTAPSADATMQSVQQFLSGDGYVLLSAATAERLAIRQGDSFSVLSNGKSNTAILAGVVAAEDQPQMANLVIADIAVAQHWLGMQGKLSRIDAKLDADDHETEEIIRAALPPGSELLSSAGRTQTTADMSNAFMTNLMAMSLLAMLVGVFLIYNSMAFAVLQRRDLIGVLRALGVTRAQLFRIILIEAILIGIVGATLGVLLGTWLGEKLLMLVARTLSDHYFVVNVTAVSVSTFSIAKGILTGLGATIVAAAVPAIEAANYPPRLALARSVLEQRTGNIIPFLGAAGIALIVCAIGLLVFSGQSLIVGLNALFILIMGFAFCIPVFVRFMSAALEPLAGRVAGTAGRLAIGGVGKTLSRTGVAVVALSIAVSATIGVSVMVESFRTSVNDWLGTSLQSDIYVGVPRGAMDPELIGDLTAIPGIGSFSSSRRSWLETAEGRTRIIALQMAPGSYAGFKIRGGDSATIWWQYDEEGAVLISDSMAYRQSLRQGDSIELNTSKGLASFEIAAVFQSYDSNDGAILMSRSTYDSFFDDPAIDSLGIYLQPGVSVETIMQQFRDISSGRQALIMSSNADIREMSLQIFDRTFVITNVLYWLAVGVAIIGILGAMLALQLERAKEFGVLRALGMTPRQTGLLVSTQTAFIGFLSGIAAIPLGLAMAWVLIEVINKRAFGWQIDFTVPAGVLLWAMLLAVGAALLAGLYPSWKAARTRPALAMRDE